MFYQNTSSMSILITLSPVVWWIINIYIWLVIIRVLVSWFSPNQYTPFMGFLRKVCDPALRTARRVCSLTLGGMDFTPVLLILFLSLMANFLSDGMKIIGLGMEPDRLLPLFLYCLTNLVISVSWFLCLMMIIRIVMSLVDPYPDNPFVMLVYGLTEPL
ncbi:MAG: YggT family protein, partial [Deltaproteobacteria bacterium]|nr:YggT family protein [Deltaproteobacteria bacterium]